MYKEYLGGSLEFAFSIFPTCHISLSSIKVSG